MYLNFTKQGLCDLPYEAKKGARKNYYDIKEKNLYIQVGTTTKTFYVLKKVKGKAKRVKIGRFPDISLERARKICLNLKSQIAEGKTVEEIKQSHKGEATFLEIFEAYMNNPEKEGTNYWKELRRTFNRYAVPFFNRPFSSVSRKDIKYLFTEASQQSKAQANKLLVVINRMYKKKIEDDELEMLNPASGIKRNPQVARDRFLQFSELPIFFEKLNDIESDYFADYVKLSLWTGARRSNVLGMKWKDIDFISKLWTIPACESKNKTMMVLPLNDKVIDILKRRQVNNKSIYVFPSEEDPNQHIVEVKRQWKKLLQLTGITDLHPHDLRRTFGSYMAITGANLPNIAKALGHKSLQSTAIYARLNIEAVSQSSQKGIERMVQCIGGC